MDRLTLRARWILPIDSSPIAGGYVTIAAGRIAAVGRTAPRGEKIEDLGDVVLSPGLVNAHTHLEFSDLARPLGSPGMSLPEWIRLVIGERRRGNRNAASAIAAGVAESLAGGVTTIGEITTSPAAAYQRSDAEPTALLFQESIGFSAGRVDSVLQDVVRRVAATPAPVGVSPHAPYTVHQRLLEELANLATQRGLPLAMHVAESREELQLLTTGDGPFRDLLEQRSMWDGGAIAPGSRPLDYLRRMAEASRALVIHGNYLRAEEIAFLADRRKRMCVVYCPRTHAYFGHDAYPLDELLAAGATVALGTDSRASNPDLQLMAEMQRVARFYRRVSPATVFDMGTLAGARALGLEAEAGSIAAGKRADLAAWAVPAWATEPYSAVLAGSATPVEVWLRGRRVAQRWGRSARTHPGTS
jgi:cytosine/adenosine deaminase-related metal-dependent hydrolase